MASKATLAILLGTALLAEISAFPQINRITEADGFIFDGVADRPSSRPLEPGRKVDTTTTSGPSTDAPTTASGTTQSTEDLATFNTCVNACPVTSEYNPVCGTDNVQYRNPGSLTCANRCGRDVTLARFGRCGANDVRG